MRRRLLVLLLISCLSLGFTACETNKREQTNEQENIKEKLLKGADKVERSSQLYLENGLKITGLGVNTSGDAVKKNDNYYWHAIKKKTGVDLDIVWSGTESYISNLSATLLNGIDKMPDILNAADFGVMDLADDGAIVPLDDYIDLMPDIVAAVGEERMNYWRQIDGHIYTIPNIINVQGAQTMMVRKDWLDKLGLSEPKTWQEWLNLWRMIRKNDMNGDGDTSDEIPFASQVNGDGERCFIPLLNAFGIKASADTQFCQLDNGQYTMIYEHPKYREFLENLRMMYKEGLIDKDFDKMTLDVIDEAMDKDKIGTTFNWAERCRTSSQTLRASGIKKALWEASEPITGPDGTKMTPERLMLTHVWCISSAAKKKGKIENIIRFFNWCYTKEGSDLYSYGLPGISYDIKDGSPVLKQEVIESGFTDYRKAGCGIESFGGLWQESAFTQCLFEGKSENEMDEMTEEFYKGLNVVNSKYFYTMPVTYETPSYVKYRNSLIKEGICKLRNQAIKGEISIDDFFKGYEILKKKGLKYVLKDLHNIVK